MPTVRSRKKEAIAAPSSSQNLSTSASSTSSALSTAPSTSASTSAVPKAQEAVASTPFHERDNAGLLPIPTPAMKIAAYNLLEQSKDQVIRENLLLGLAVEYLSFGGRGTVKKYKLYHPDVQAIKGGLTLFYGSHKKASINLKNMNIDDQNEVHFIAQHTAHILQGFLHDHSFLLPTEECQSFIHPETESIRQWKKRNPTASLGESAAKSVKNLEEVCEVDPGSDHAEGSGSGVQSGQGNTDGVYGPGPNSDFISTFTYVQDNIAPLLLTTRTELTRDIQTQLQTLKDEINTHVTHKTIITANLLFTHMRKSLESTEQGMAERAGMMEEKLMKGMEVGREEVGGGALEEELMTILKRMEQSIMCARTEQFTTKSLLQNNLSTNQTLSARGAPVYAPTPTSIITPALAPSSSLYSHGRIQPILPIRSASTSSLARPQSTRPVARPPVQGLGIGNGNGNGSVNGYEYGYASPPPAFLSPTGAGGTTWGSRAVSHGGYAMGQGGASNGMTLITTGVGIPTEGHQPTNSQQYVNHTYYIPRSTGPSSAASSDRGREDQARKRQKLSHESLGVGYGVHTGQQNDRWAFASGPAIQINPATPNPPATDIDTGRQPVNTSYYSTQNAY